MKFFGSGLAVLALIIGAYVFALQRESRGVEDFCAALTEGSPASDIFAAADRYPGRLMGGDKLIDTDKPQNIIYCSPMTMCDVSCNVEVTNGVVTKSDFRKY